MRMIRSLAVFLCVCGRFACPAAAVEIIAFLAPVATSQPTTSAPAGSAPRIAPLQSARVGDWADYDMLQGRQTVRVVHTTMLLADVEVRSFLNGKPVGLPAVRSLRQDSDWALDFADSDGAEVKTAHDTIDVAGRRFNCRYTVAIWKTGPVRCERRVWMHAEIPVYGVARMELRVDGKVTARMNLASYGRGPDAAQPAPSAPPAHSATHPTDQP